MLAMRLLLVSLVAAAEGNAGTNCSAFGVNFECPLEVQAATAFETPAGWQCSDGVNEADWTTYLDQHFLSYAPSPLECWAAVQAEFPNAEGFMYITAPVCRAMTNFVGLEPTLELADEYPDYQGTSGICIPAAATTTTTTEPAFVDAASSGFGGAALGTVAAGGLIAMMKL